MQKPKSYESFDPWLHLPEDVRKGLTSQPKTIPCKYFYDSKGSSLFDEICRLPEYYQTRTEESLLKNHSEEIAGLTQARELVELGSGTASKTQVLIQAFLQNNQSLTYIPMDISPFALEEAEARLHSHPDLHIHPLVGDYTRNLTCITPRQTCLVLFLGSTIGNLTLDQVRAMLTKIAGRLNPGDWFLLGVDLIKDPEIIEAAYNDTQGITAQFNKNILEVINHRLSGNFPLNLFSHRAFFNMDKNQIEMHLFAEKDLSVYLKKIDLLIRIQKGESILTEISRKFHRGSVQAMMEATGFRLKHWLESSNGYFALALSQID